MRGEAVPTVSPSSTGHACHAKVKSRCRCKGEAKAKWQVAGRQNNTQHHHQHPGGQVCLPSSLSQGGCQDTWLAYRQAFEMSLFFSPGGDAMPWDSEADRLASPSLPLQEEKLDSGKPPLFLVLGWVPQMPQEGKAL